MFWYVGSGILLFLSIYCWLGIKKAYDKGQILPLNVSVAIWFLDMVHLLLVVVSSLYSVWPLPLSKMAALIGGLIMVGAGLAIMLAAMIQFRSLRRISGRDTSRLVTTGLYRWSRNPQYAGWFSVLLGISLIGRSGLALLFTLAFIVAIHLYTTWLEEPYLEHIFGEQYLVYKSKTPRYIPLRTSWWQDK